MTRKEVKKRIEKLKREINHHRYLYHVLDKQEISDDALDSLKHELKKLEVKHIIFVRLLHPRDINNNCSQRKIELILGLIVI
jgi:NAD-dependent DNA ligase